MSDRRNWDASVEKEKERRLLEKKDLLDRKEKLSKRIRSLKSVEIKSPLYEQLKLEQAEVQAKLATL